VRLKVWKKNSVRPAKKDNHNFVFSNLIYNYMVAEHTSELINSLSKKDRQFVVNLIDKMHADPSLVKRLCVFVSLAVGQEEVDRFMEMSEEFRVQACVEYLVIAMASGDVKRKEIQSLIH